MDTDELVEYLNGWWSTLMAEATITAEFIADAVEAYYLADPTLDPSWARPLADYLVLRRGLTEFLTDFDVSIEGDSYRLSQRADRLQKLFDEAYGKVSWLVSEDDADIGKVVTVTVPYLTGPRPAVTGQTEW